MGQAYQLYNNFLFSKAGSRGVPLSGTFELTSRCNLDCKMCYIHKRANDARAIQYEKSTEDWLALAEECQRAGMLILLLTGGEPFLRPDFEEIYTRCKRLGMLVSINSNGTLIDERRMDFLARDPPSRINITLYGASPETYGTLCGDPSAFQRAVNAILGLQKRGVLVKVNYTMTPYNRRDARKIYTFCRRHGLPLQTATYLFPPVRACEQGCCLTERMPPRKAAEAQLEEEAFRYPPGEFRKRLQDLLAGNRVPDPADECQELPTERIRCRAGSSTFWVTWDWKLRPCGMMTTPSIDLENGAFSSDWQALRQARQEILIPAKCTSCPMKNACSQCPATCYAETGSFTGVPDYLCEKTRWYLELAKEKLNNEEQFNETL